MLKLHTLAIIGVVLGTCAVPSRGQEAGALVDALVKKGILTSEEAEEIRADMSREHAKTPAGKIKLSNSITELKLYGDVRLRYQYDHKDAQLDPLPIGDDRDRSPSGTQRRRGRPAAASCRRAGP